jgi:hypothetical protein
MNQDFSEIVTIHNIDDEDFEFSYNASEGNAPYTIPAGEVARYPKFLADHALKHLIDKILTKKNIKTNNELARMEVANQIVIGSESIRGEPKLNEAEKLRKEVEELNKSSTLDAILARRKAEKEEPKKVEETPTTERTEDVTEKFEGLEEKKEEVDKKLEEIKEEEAKKVIPMPTRTELLDYAVKQNLVLDEPNKEGKTLRQIYATMKIEDLVKELQFPLEDK